MYKFDIPNFIVYNLHWYTDMVHNAVEVENGLKIACAHLVIAPV